MNKTYKQITLDEYIKYWEKTLNTPSQAKEMIEEELECWFCTKTHENIHSMITAFCTGTTVYDTYSCYFCDENCMNLYILNGGKGVDEDEDYIW